MYVSTVPYVYNSRNESCTHTQRKEILLLVSLISICFDTCFEYFFCSVDASSSKRKGRYINDEWQSPNAVVEKLECHNKPRLAIFAKRRIDAGEEIRYNYGIINAPWRQNATDKQEKDSEDLTAEKSDMNELTPHVGEDSECISEMHENKPLPSEDHQVLGHSQSELSSASSCLVPNGEVDISCSEHILDKDGHQLDEEKCFDSLIHKCKFLSIEDHQQNVLGDSQNHTDSASKFPKTKDVANISSGLKVSSNDSYQLPAEEDSDSKHCVNDSSSFQVTHKGDRQSLHQQKHSNSEDISEMHAGKSSSIEKNEDGYEQSKDSAGTGSESDMSECKPDGEESVEESSYMEDIPEMLDSKMSSTEDNQQHVLGNSQDQKVSTPSFLTSKGEVNISSISQVTHQSLDEQKHSNSEDISEEHASKSSSIEDNEDDYKQSSVIQKTQEVNQMTVKVTGYDETTQNHRVPSLALKYGHSLKKMASIVTGNASELGDDVKYTQNKQFIKRCDADWSVFVSSNALRTLNMKKMNNKKMIHLTEDVAALTNTIKEKARQCV
ncbi:hypothetical protein HOLleu_42874 [Holothuria leucospilota]|uniref:SET domain-containing protein n=1 Tax=Holothuria leucospilota TaxID=206669 RepID=A0A9Q1BB42_HOLLE|nr:hypothetical protein HOLleu_42874 [Holothuria leucospilota]